MQMKFIGMHSVKKMIFPNERKLCDIKPSTRCLAIFVETSSMQINLRAARLIDGLSVWEKRNGDNVLYEILKGTCCACSYLYDNTRGGIYFVIHIESGDGYENAVKKAQNAIDVKICESICNAINNIFDDKGWELYSILFYKCILSDKGIEPILPQTNINITFFSRNFGKIDLVRQTLREIINKKGIYYTNEYGKTEEKEFPMEILLRDEYRKLNNLNFMYGNEHWRLVFSIQINIEHWKYVPEDIIILHFRTLKKMFDGVKDFLDSSNTEYEKIDYYW